MLALKQALSLVSSKDTWQPDDESGIEAWFRYKRLITFDDEFGAVSSWGDSMSGSMIMGQTDTDEQPTYSLGAITFDSSSYPQNLQLEDAAQISLTDDFTIALRINMLSAGGVILGDNTTVGEFIKYTTASQMRIKIDNSSIDISLDSGTFGDDYLVITRSDNLITLWKNGVAQADTETLAGTSDIDTIGVRRIDLNPLDAAIKDIQIYSTESSQLTANINDYLSLL